MTEKDEGSLSTAEFLANDMREDSRDDEDDCNSQSTDDTIKVDSDSETLTESPKREKKQKNKKSSQTKETESPTDSTPSTPTTTKKRARIPYRCNKCRQIKKGHICPMAKKDDEDDDEEEEKTDGSQNMEFSGFGQNSGSSTDLNTPIMQRPPSASKIQVFI